METILDLAIILACLIVFALIMLRRMRINSYSYTYSCQWEYSGDPEFCYHTDCGEAVQFIEGKLEDNNYTYCPYCSRKIKHYFHEEEHV